MIVVMFTTGYFLGLIHILIHQAFAHIFL